MELRLGIKGLGAFFLAALAGICAVSVWAANDPVSDHPFVGELEVEPIELLDAEALETLVAPVALYPDDLLAVVLPASTYPVQVVLAARFLEDQDENAGSNVAEPSEEWDDAVVALLNYPEVVALMDGNLDWTRRLGEAVIVQEEDVIAAISAFREQAKDVGNLESDGKQDVVVNDAGAIEIKPAVPNEIYVPYYEPEQVIVRQPTRVYHYYPRPYPVYYYPYHQGFDFAHGPFWGVTSAFSIGWHTRNLHLHHYGFNDHPYYSYRYYDPFYYRRPHLVLNVYDRDRRHRHRHRSDRHHRGNDWRSERSKRDHRKWADRGDRRRGERRGEDRRRGDRQRRAQQDQGQSIARAVKDGAAPVMHRPTQITPLGEVQPRPTANRRDAARAQPAEVASANPAPVQRTERQRTERQRTQRWRAQRRGENVRLSNARSQVVKPGATIPAQRPNRALPNRQAQRQTRSIRSAQSTQPAAAQPGVNASTSALARQSQHAARLVREQMVRPAPVRPQASRNVEVQRRASRTRSEVNRATRINRAPPPRAQRSQAANQQAGRQAQQQARPQATLSRGVQPRVQRPSPAVRQATRQAVPQVRPQARVNRQAPARVDRAATPVRPARVAQRTERPAPQRPVRSRPERSGDDFRSRRPR